MASFQDSPPTVPPPPPPPPPPGPVLSLPIVDRDQWFDPSKLPKKPVKPWKDYKLKTDFEIGNPLGQGAYGYVYLARTPRTNFYVALKVIHAKQVVDEGLEKQVRREQDVHMDLDHPNVIKMFGYFRDDDKIVCVLEYAPGGNVYDEMRKQPLRRFSDFRAATYIRQITSALQYLHGKKILHRDIKPENLLIGYKGEIKMADFGISVKRGICSRLGGNTTECGTLEYLAPEVVDQKPYHEQVDLWSLGVITYEFLVGKTPFVDENFENSSNSESHILNLISSGDVKIPSFVTGEAKDLIKGLLKKDPKQRIKLKDVQSHVWIKGNTSSTVTDDERLSSGYLSRFQPYLNLLPEIKRRYDKAAEQFKNRHRAK